MKGEIKIFGFKSEILFEIASPDKSSNTTEKWIPSLAQLNIAVADSIDAEECIIILQEDNFLYLSLFIKIFENVFIFLSNSSYV